MKILIALPGLHKYSRGAEVAFISVARELAKLGEDVTLVGSGNEAPGEPYRFLHIPSISREHFESFPRFPAFRNEYAYEDFTFSLALLRLYRPKKYDITVTCNYPFTNWVLQSGRRRSGQSRHVFVTENGDWPAQATSGEFRFFSCDGLVCTNPDFYDRNKARWRSKLIPNGIDCDRFSPRKVGQYSNLATGSFRVLMVSALMPTKRVLEGIEAVAQIPQAHLIVAGDGPLRSKVDELGNNLLRGRFTRVTVPASEMPDLYRSADVFLHLSKEEAFGNVFLEALASGLPVVAHDTPRVRWIVGQNEFLVDTRDLAAVASVIRRASTFNSAENIAQRTKRAVAFSWDKIASQYCDFFKEILFEARRAASKPPNMAKNKVLRGD
jgi:glycosyltransferase involved in cell wall biosynthesis